MSTDREALQQIANIANAQLGGGGGGGGSGQPVPAITTKPGVDGDLGEGYSAPFEKHVAPYQVIGLTMKCRAGVTARELWWGGKPGDIFNYTSWAIFDSGGSRVMGQDNFMPAGSLGMKVQTDQLKVLGAGVYTLAISIDGPAGNLAVQFNQQP